MNLGMTSLAAPNAASSRTARYSSTARPAASRGRPAAPSRRARSLASAWIRLASTANPSPPTRPSAMQRCSTVSNNRRSRSLFAETAMAVLREGRMIGHLAVEPEPAKPAIRQVEVHLFAQPPLRADAEAIADDQHANQQLWIDRRPADLTVEGHQLSP